MRCLGVILVAACSFTPQTTPAPADAAPDAPLPPPAERCMTRYGALDRYELCSATETSCTFYVEGPSGTLCSTLCSQAGGTCLDNFDGDCANTADLEACQEGHQSQVCICSL
jgi:hypothetical protein